MGESYYQENLKQICGGYSESGAEMILTAKLVYDDGNQYDNEAIRVEISGKTVGHLSRTDARSYRTHMHSNGWNGLPSICKAKITGGWNREGDDFGNFGVALDLPPDFIKSLNNGISANQNQDDSNETDCLIFYVDGPNIQNFTQVGMHVKLWIPKDNPEKVFIFQGDGPDGRLGVVPSKHTSIIVSHIEGALDYEAKIVELSPNTCKIKCRLISKEETEHRKAEDKESIRNELTRVYKPKKPITLMLATNKKNAVKVGDKLIIEFDDLDSYVQNESDQRGPYSYQWHIKFLNQTGKTIGVFDHNKSTIQKILKAHFNSYLFDVEVLDTFTHLDYSEAKERSNWKGYPIKLVITPYKSSNTTCS